MEPTRTDQEDRDALEVVCTECEARKRIDIANEAVAFYRRHRPVTGHDVRWERTELDVLVGITTDDLEAAIRDLEGHFTDGVPIGVVTAAMSGRGATVGETLAAVRDLRMAGDLYEPRDDHLRVT